MAIRKLTKNEIKNGYVNYLTVGKLKEFLSKHNLPDDAPVLVERVEDIYYDGVDISGMGGNIESPDGIYPPGSKAEGWGVFLREGYSYSSIKYFNEKMYEEIARRARGEEPKYPKIDDPSKFLEELDDDLKDQFTPAWCCSQSNDEDSDILFIMMH